jgi:hypothetical protein
MGWMMTAEEQAALEEFGKAIITEVRDDACRFLERVVTGKMRDETSKRYYQEYQRLHTDCRVAIQHFCLAAVDACLARFLNYFETHEIPIAFRSMIGRVIDVRAVSDGLVGELYNEGGWIAKYSSFKDQLTSEE